MTVKQLIEELQKMPQEAEVQDDFGFLAKEVIKDNEEVITIEFE